MSFFNVMKNLVLSASIACASTSFAAAKTLITFEGGKAGPGIAKSWKKGKGNYTFTLDMTSDIGQGAKSIPDVVKSSLESKLAASNGVKVTTKGKDAVVVAFTGDENAFLDAVSKTRIRAEQNVEIAMESTVSQGGVRAKTSERDPVDGEVKGTVISTTADTVIIRVVTSSSKTKGLGINDGDKVEVKAKAYAAKKGDPVFFTPATKDGAAWNATSVKAN